MDMPDKIDSLTQYTVMSSTDSETDQFLLGRQRKDAGKDAGKDAKKNAEKGEVSCKYKTFSS